MITLREALIIRYFSFRQLPCPYFNKDRSWAKAIFRAALKYGREKTPLIPQIFTHQIFD